MTLCGEPEQVYLWSVEHLHAVFNISFIHSFIPDCHQNVTENSTTSGHRIYTVSLTKHNTATERTAKTSWLFNRRVFTLVADKLERQWLQEVGFGIED